MITDQNDVFGNIEKEFPEYEFRCKNMLLIIPQSCEFPKNPTREEHGIKAIDNLPEVFNDKSRIIHIFCLNFQFENLLR